MKKTRTVFASVFILLFCVTIFRPALSIPAALIEVSAIQEGKAIALDGDSATLIIPVWKNEQVFNASPDTNHHGIINLGGLWVGIDGNGDITRSFVSFDLSHLPAEIAFISARLHAFMSGDFPTADGNDTAIGVYHCAEDTWDETLITWNNQPVTSVSPTDVIDNPGSPGTFILNTWYSWDVTSDVRTALAGDKLLTESIRNVDESAPPHTGKSFTKTEYYQFNATYIELGYTTPAISQIAVDGHSSTPLIDYIQDDTPLMSWTHDDPDPNDLQYDYEVEVWNDPIFNDTILWSESNTFIQPVFYENSSTNPGPFSIDNEMRFQFKYDSSIMNRSGTVDKLHFYVVEDEGILTLENLIVRIASTNVTGALTTDFEGNYGTSNPITVLKRGAYEATIQNSILAIDIENIYVMSHDLNLIIEIRFTGLDGTLTMSELDASSSVGWVAYEYGAGDYTATTAGNLFPRCHSFDIELASMDIQSESTVEYAGAPLVDSTRYYWRVRTCDSTGVWTTWNEQSFKYEVLTSAPTWEGPLANPSPVVLGEEVEVSINVTYFLGVNQVVIEYDGASHPMTSAGDMYSHTWTPSVVGTSNYTILMESAIGTWSSVDGSFNVVVGFPVDPLLLVIIGGGIVVVLALVVLRKKKGGKK